MRHRHHGWQLGRTTAHRQATLRNMAVSLFRHERIQTTTGKAKALRPFAERLITTARREGVHARRLVARDIHDREVLKKLFDTLAARFSGRPGGYIRLLRLGTRWGDGAEMSLVELVGSELKLEKKDDKKKSRKGKPAADAKGAAAKPELPEAARGTGPAAREHTHAHPHPGAGRGGRRDRGTGMIKKGQ